MSLREETEILRRTLEQLAGEFETGLDRRYALRFPLPESLTLYRRLRVNVGRLLRWLGLMRARPLEPWLTGLNHVECSEGARPFVIWALATDRDTLRTACRGFEVQHAALPGWVPVLITDVADFAFFSRLGWLVEYVPDMSGPADNYAARKQRYLAWRYRDAPALPVSAGLTEDVPIGELLID
jgi:hypothetical protein